MSVGLARLETLSRQYLDGQRGRAPASMVNCAAHMLFHVEDRRQMAEIALDYLLEVVGGDRADVGFARPDATVYRPSAVRLAAGSTAPDFVGLTLPNRDPGIQIVYRSAEPVFIEVDHHPAVARLRPVLREQLGVRLKLSRRIEAGEGVFGIVCIDRMESERPWTPAEIDLFDRFVAGFLGPLLAETLKAEGEAPALTPAERDVLRLAGQGLTYKEIALRLDKSPHTVDNQLRGLRAKFGARNQVELLRTCANLV